jgi:hypothetical protein
MVIDQSAPDLLRQPRAMPTAAWGTPVLTSKPPPLSSRWRVVSSRPSIMHDRSIHEFSYTCASIHFGQPVDVILPFHR